MACGLRHVLTCVAAFAVLGASGVAPARDGSAVSGDRLVASDADTRLRVRFHNEGNRYTPRSFAWQVLVLALRTSGANYRLLPVSDPDITEPRARKLMLDGEIDLMWVGTSAAYEADLLPIYIPIARGLLGMRIFLIRAADQPVFDTIRTVAALQDKIGLMGLGWADNAIMLQAGLDLQTARFEHLPDMLAQGRGDYFSRGVTEVAAEWRTLTDRHPTLAIERGLMLYYKHPLLFFVAPTRPDLHAAIDTGLRAAHADGSYDALFASHPDAGGAIADLNLKGRTVLRLDNPLLSEDAHAIPDRYWYTTRVPHG